MNLEVSAFRHKMLSSVQARNQVPGTNFPGTPRSFVTKIQDPRVRLMQMNTGCGSGFQVASASAAERTSGTMLSISESLVRWFTMQARKQNWP